MNIRLAPTTGTTFAEVPFRTLDACHEEIAAMLDRMSEMACRLQNRFPDDALQEQARTTHLFFSGHAIEHHLDEERHVFPALMATGNPQWIAIVRQLKLEHARLESHWTELGLMLHLVARGYRPDPQLLARKIASFVELYRQHIALEDSIAYPGARALLDEQEVRNMNLEMAHRRVINGLTTQEDEAPAPESEDEDLFACR